MQLLREETVMKNKIRDYIEGIFENAPKTKRAMDLKEEIYTNICDKFDDLIAQGKSEETAYEIVIASIGDIEEILKTLEPEGNYDSKIESYRKRSALIITISVALYIFAIVLLIIFEEVFSNDVLSIVSFFVVAAIPTCMLVYNGLTKPSYVKKDDTIVEQFKEWQASGEKIKKIQSSISSIIWTVAVAIFLITGMLFGAWWYMWIIFIVAVAVQNIVNLLINMKSK